MSPSSTAGARRRLLAVAVAAVAVTAVPVAAASAAPRDHSATTVTGPASAGLPAAPPLERFVAVPRVRMLLPAVWRARRAPAGRLAFRTPGTSCRYDVTFTVSTRVGPPAEAQALVADALPDPARILSEGARDGGAFRVVKARATAGVALDGVWTRVLTRRADLVPAGQVAFAAVRVAARSVAGSECHSGTYRQVLGPQLGDAFATATASVRFSPRP